MRIDIVTLFPEVFEGILRESIIGRAIRRELVDIRTVNLRDFTHDSRKTVDDRPYGGGPGMLMKPEPLFEAVESLRQPDSTVILTSPQGRVFDQSLARCLASRNHLILLCGHYEGIDERVREGLADMEISIGDYVLTNGNLPAMVVADAVARLIPGVLGDAESAGDESFSHGLLEYPQYTRPPDFRGMRVPEILLSGNHEAIAEWRRGQAEARTRERRPDLMDENRPFRSPNDRSASVDE